MSRPATRRRTGRIRTALLFVALGVSAAFVVSALATYFGDRGPGAPDALNPAETTVRVEVLNGAGITGLARNATTLLRQRGFDVVFYGNADTFGRDSSVVLARTHDPAAAEAVARALGIGAVRMAPDSSVVLDATVVLGRDWR